MDNADKSTQVCCLAPGGRLPHLHLRPTGGSEVFAIRAERQANDVVLVPGQLLDLFAGSDLPNLYLLVRIAANQQVAVAAEHYTVDAALVLEFAGRLPNGSVPEARNSVHAPRGYVGSVRAVG